MPCNLMRVYMVAHTPGSEAPSLDQNLCSTNQQREVQTRAGFTCLSRFSHNRDYPIIVRGIGWR
eukprot:3537898-Amphidinium_carterae.1